VCARVRLCGMGACTTFATVLGLQLQQLLSSPSIPTINQPPSAPLRSDHPKPTRQHERLRAQHRALKEFIVMRGRQLELPNELLEALQGVCVVCVVGF